MSSTMTEFGKTEAQTTWLSAKATLRLGFPETQGSWTSFFEATTPAARSHTVHNSLSTQASVSGDTIRRVPAYLSEIDPTQDLVTGLSLISQPTWRSMIEAMPFSRADY